MATKRPRNDDTATAAEPSKKKHRSGFKVGPDNLPDGPWRRRNDKIKENLIQKAKIKKAYAKIKAREEKEALGTHRPDYLAEADKQQQQEEEEERLEEREVQDTEGVAVEGEEAPGSQIHPERQAMLDEPSDPSPDDTLNPNSQPVTQRRKDASAAAGPLSEEPADSTVPPLEGAPTYRAPLHRNRKPRRPGYFDKELEASTRKKAEAEARHQEWAKREEDKKRKMEDRERYRRAMAKAKTPGRDGKRKLGRESGLLLDRVRRLVNSDKKS